MLHFHCHYKCKVCLGYFTLIASFFSSLSFMKAAVWMSGGKLWCNEFSLKWVCSSGWFLFQHPWECFSRDVAHFLSITVALIPDQIGSNGREIQLRQHKQTWNKASWLAGNTTLICTVSNCCRSRNWFSFLIYELEKRNFCHWKCFSWSG